MPTLTAAPATADLSDEHTVPRSLVHRWSLSEVFLTDSRAVGEGRFAAAAQLPLSHSYYRDHTGGFGFHDALLVLEACRQSVTYAAHLHEDVPRETTFMVTAWSLAVSDGEALACGERPGRLRIDGRVTGRRHRAGRLRSIDFAMELELDGRPLGRLTMDVGCTPTDQYLRLRRMQRGAEVPTAFTLGAEPAGTPVDPAAVRRLDPGNAVLDGVAFDGDGVSVSAALSPRTFRNRSMYDHPYDHVPAMVFSEAARQCALLLSGGADAAGPGRVLWLDGSFEKFAELDDDVHLSARPDGGDGADGFRMRAVQQGDTVAEIALVLG